MRPADPSVFERGFVSVIFLAMQGVFKEKKREERARVKGRL